MRNLFGVRKTLATFDRAMILVIKFVLPCILLERVLYIRDLLGIFTIDTDVSLCKLIGDEKTNSLLGDGERVGVRLMVIEMNVIHRVLVPHCIVQSEFVNDEV